MRDPWTLRAVVWLGAHPRVNAAIDVLLAAALVYDVIAAAFMWRN